MTTLAAIGSPCRMKVRAHTCKWLAVSAQLLTGEWVILDLGQPRLVSQFKFLAETAESCPTDVQLSSSDLPGYVWAKWCIAVQTSVLPTNAWCKPLDFTPRVARFWRIQIKKSTTGTVPRIAQLALNCSAFNQQFRSDTNTIEPSPSASTRCAWLLCTA